MYQVNSRQEEWKSALKKKRLRIIKSKIEYTEYKFEGRK